MGTMFEANTAKQAILLARQALGEDALILNVERLPRGVRVQAVSSKSEQKSTLLEKRMESLELERGQIVQRISGGAKDSKERAYGEVGSVFLRWGFDESVCIELGQIGEAFSGSLKDRVLRALAFKIDQLQQNAGPLPLQTGGLIAMVGPTGTGKTTTIAKLAARAVERWGTNSVALISTDFYRIGAMEQLRVFAQLLDLPLYPVKTQQELVSVISILKNKKMVLIDTIGASREDEKAKFQMQWLQSVEAKCLLALQASIDKSVQKKDLLHWGSWGVKEVIATKVDEVGNIKELLNNCLSQNISLRAFANGQKVPEDLHWVSGNLLAHKAIKEFWNDI